MRERLLSLHADFCGLSDRILPSCYQYTGDVNQLPGIKPKESAC